MYTIKGELKEIRKEQQISDSFKKREFVLTDMSGQYPETILFQTVQDRSFLLDKFKEGDMVEIYFNIRGREWTNPQGEVKYFNSFDVWKIINLLDSKKSIVDIISLDIKEEDQDGLPF